MVVPFTPEDAADDSPLNLLRSGKVIPGPVPASAVSPQLGAGTVGVRYFNAGGEAGAGRAACWMQYEANGDPVYSEAWYAPGELRFGDQQFVDFLSVVFPALGEIGNPLPGKVIAPTFHYRKPVMVDGLDLPAGYTIEAAFNVHLLPPGGTVPTFAVGRMLRLKRTADAMFADLWLLSPAYGSPSLVASVSFTPVPPPSFANFFNSPGAFDVRQPLAEIAATPGWRYAQTTYSRISVPV